VTAQAGRYQFSGVLWSEWIKLRTVRSTRWSLLALVVVTVAIGIGISVPEAHGVAHSAARRAGFDPTNWSLSVLGFSQFLIGVVGVLVMSGEYSGGSIGTSLAAVPNRVRLLAAKAVVAGAAALLLGEVITFSMFFSGQAILASAGAPHATLGQPGVLRAVALSGLFLALLALFGLGLGTICRRAAGAIAAYAGATFVSVFVLLGVGAGRYAPEIMLLNSVSAVRPQPESGLAPGWDSIAVMGVYAAVALVAGGILLVRRDA
jgi:ABC-2 type transport system permease protein